MIDQRRGGYVAGGGRRSAAFRGPLLGGLRGAWLVVALLFVGVALFNPWPLFFVLWWVVPFLLIPALRFSPRTAGHLEGSSSPLPDLSEDRKERELLQALESHGEITPARAALATSLSVSAADRILGELAKNGHIEVRAREGRAGYALWHHDRRESPG